jgi:[protein-PII] uridylyltransferase
MPFDSGLDRERLKEIRGRIAQDATTRASPKEFLRQWSEVVDGLVRKTFQKAQSQGASSVCLVAVGGYGRSELAPYSDVDLLLLHPPSPQANLQRFIEQTLYPLWDLGLEVSCSSRSIPECLKMARSDLQIKTSLIDDRYLDGEYELFRNLHELFVKRVLHRKVHEFAEALIKELHLCHLQYQDPAYVLEPNIKDGEGGLRDFQIGRWIIRAKYRTDRWDSIVFPDHSRSLDKNIRFLWSLRNQLHLLSGRKQDVLTFELQERIAPILGFCSDTQGIEEMMRQYHLSTQLILNFVLGVLQRARSEPSAIKKAYFHFKDSRIDAHFRIRSGELSLVDPVTFKREPSQLIVLFKHCQTFRVEMDYRTEEAVMEALPFVDDLFRQVETVNRSFLGILNKGERSQVILRKMHELGFLSRYIPEFSMIEGKVHYDLYHVHPVDIHSILAVEELGKLRVGTYREEYPLLTSLVNEIDKPELLFLTALLHDIGKGSEGDHSLVGAAMAVDIGGRMGLPAEEKELIHFLVCHHLFMLEIALRRDLRDEQVILRFAREVGNSKRLKMLYLLTFADVKAVGPEAWTSWKGSLLMELFLKTFHLFERPEVVGPLSKSEEVVEKLGERLPREVVSQYAEHLPPRYLSCYSWEEICRHVEMASSLEREALLVRWSTEGERRAEITLCTKDRGGLFSKVAGSMFLNGLNVLEAQIHTWANGVALDTFRVEDATGEVKRRLQQWEGCLEEILSQKDSLMDLLSQKKLQPYLSKVVPRVSADVRINNKDSDFHTIIEVIGEDRLGILYELAQTLNDCGCNIHFARISTLGNRIIDVFYVQDAWGEKVEGKDQLDLLRRTLLDRCVSRDEMIFPMGRELLKSR